MHRPLHLFLLLFLLGTCGCGLATYESKMEEEQDRIKSLDEESANLDGPVDFPEVKEGNKVLIKKTDVFFRPPRGISRKFEKNPPNPLFSVYSGRGQFKQVMLAVTTKQILAAEKRSEEDFPKAVLSALGAGSMTLGKRRVEQRAARPPREVALQTARIDDAGRGTTYVANFYKDKDYLVAVVFEVSGDLKKVDGVVDLSLATLYAGSRARDQHARSKAPPPPAPSGKGK